MIANIINKLGLRINEMKNVKVPFLDISRKIAKHRQGILKAVEDVVASSSFVMGQYVEKFEQQFASYLGTNWVISCANGTDALELALKSLGLKDDTTVLTTAHAGNYSSFAINECRLKAKYVDIEVNSWNVSVNKLEENLGSDVGAVIVTHLYGIVNKEIMEIATLCKSRNIKLIEDCAQAHGALLNNKRVGSFGDVSTFSFYPTKNLGALGDGGALATNNLEIAARAQMLRQYGWREKYYVEVDGGRNSRLDAIQAAILSYLLPFLDEENEQRRKIATVVRSALKDKFNFQESNLLDDVFHLLTLSTPKRDELINHLWRNGIESQIHYPLPDHLQTTALNYRSSMSTSLQVTEALASQVLSLPGHPNLTNSELDLLISTLKSF